MTNNDTTQMSIAELQHHMKNKLISPVEVVTKVIDKAAEKNAELNAFITLTHERALQQAKIAETEIIQGNFKGPLHGIPVGIKDLIHLKGYRTTCGSALKSEETASFHAEIVGRLEHSGAIIIGKENMHSLAYGSTGDVSHFGPAKNPLNHKLITGGSSSGSAAAVAGNLSYGSIGSDTGGSIRIPAAYCGVVGMKPTFGLVSRYGTASFAPTLDTLGPITRTVEDNSFLLEAIAGYDPKDPFSVRHHEYKYSDFMHHDNFNKTIGIPDQFYFDIIDDEIKTLFDRIVEALTTNGFKVKLVEVPYMQEIDAALSVIFATEVYESLKEDMQEAPEKIEPEIRNRILEGFFIKGHEYISMHRVKHKAIKAFTKALQQVDVLMTPTLCAFPGETGKREVEINGEKINIRKVYSRLVRASNLTGFPAISIPKGFSNTGLSNPIQLIGLPFQERKVYAYASVIEQL